MPLDITTLSNEPLSKEHIGQWGDSWRDDPLFCEEIVPPGKYSGVIYEVVEVKALNRHLTLATVHVEVIDALSLAFGKPEEYSRKHFGIGWHKLYKDWQKWSGADYLLKGASVAASPNSTEHLERILKEMRDDRLEFTFEVVWKPFCRERRDQKLMQLTGATTFREAKDRATRGDWIEAKKQGLVPGGHEIFPATPDGRTKLDRFVDPNSGRVVEARAKIARFLIE